MKIKRILSFIPILLSLVLNGACLYLNNYSYLRGGLYKHLYYRRWQYEAGILNSKNNIVQGIIALLVLGILSYLLMRAKNTSKRLLIVISIISLLIASYLRFIKTNLLIYPYMLLVNLIFGSLTLLISLLIREDP